MPSIFNEGERLTFPIDNYTVNGHRWNHPGKKKILIVHGFESSSKNFDRYITSLIAKDYEVIAFDAPAHGQSTGKQINLSIYLETIEKISALYGPIQGFVGHSYGGLILAHFLERYAHDHHTKAVFIAPATETTTTLDSFFQFLRMDGGVRKEFDRLIYNKSGKWPGHYSIRRTMPLIKAEILWFHDEEDDMTPVKDALKVREDNHPNIRFVITRGLGHRRIYRDHEVVREAVDFL